MSMPAPAKRSTARRERSDVSIAFKLNGTPVSCDAAPSERLTEVLRRHLDHKGTKSGCDAGDCGACTVLIDGETACACLVSAAQAEDSIRLRRGLVVPIRVESELSMSRSRPGS